MIRTRQLAGFAAVGAIGFAADAGVLTLLSQSFGVDVYLARLFSFATAVLVTWLLNRTWVFGVSSAPGKRKGRELSRYFVVQAGGALLNLATFATLIWWLPGLRSMPVVPLAAGAVLGLAFNFSGSRLWVFEEEYS